MRARVNMTTDVAVQLVTSCDFNHWISSMESNQDRSMMRLASRIIQIESHTLDSELEAIIDKSIESLEVPRIAENAKLLTKLYIYWNLMRDYTTPGLNVYNVSFYDSNNNHHEILEDIRPGRWKLIMTTALKLITPHLEKNLQGRLVAQNMINKLRMPLFNFDNLKLMIKSLNIINFLLFLREGRYLSLDKRLVGVVMGVSDEFYGTNMANLHVQMEILNREIIWKALAEFITTVTPLMNSPWVRKKLSRLSSWTHGDKLSDAYSKRSYVCGICTKQPFNPLVKTCNHVFCYYCLQSESPSNPESEQICPLCPKASIEA